MFIGSFCIVLFNTEKGLAYIANSKSYLVNHRFSVFFAFVCAWIFDTLNGFLIRLIRNSISLELSAQNVKYRAYLFINKNFHSFFHYFKLKFNFEINF